MTKLGFFLINFLHIFAKRKIIWFDPHGRCIPRSNLQTRTKPQKNTVATYPLSEMSESLYIQYVPPLKPMHSTWIEPVSVQVCVLARPPPSLTCPKFHLHQPFPLYPNKQKEAVKRSGLLATTTFSSPLFPPVDSEHAGFFSFPGLKSLSLCKYYCSFNAWFFNRSLFMKIFFLKHSRFSAPLLFWPLLIFFCFSQFV